jgi:hypothetical protein
LFLAFALALPGVLHASADIHGDAMVSSEDISILASCFGQDPTGDCARADADADEDGDIDGDDFSFVSERLGEAYPETLFEEQDLPPAYPVGATPISIALSDVNGDGALDIVGSGDSSIFVLLGNRD